MTHNDDQELDEILDELISICPESNIVGMSMYATQHTKEQLLAWRDKPVEKELEDLLARITPPKGYFSVISGKTVRNYVENRLAELKKGTSDDTQ